MLKSFPRTALIGRRHESLPTIMPTALRSSLADEIRKKILRAHNLAPGDKLPTIRAMARTFNVTPSRVLHAIIALEETGEVVRRHGSGCYAGTPRDTSPEGARSVETLSLLVPRHRRRSVVPALIENLLSAAQDAGFILHVQETGAFPHQEQAAIRRTIEGGARALILYPQEHRPPEDDPLGKDEPTVPMIIIGDVSANPHLPRVSFDEEGCGLQMASALARHGRRRIALWHLRDESAHQLAPGAEGRYKGLLRSRMLQHLPEWDITELSLRPDQQPEQALAKVWFDKWSAADPAKRPDCIWALEDSRAALLQRLAAQEGTNVPDKLTVCGADSLDPYHGIGSQDFPTTKPDYGKMARCVVQLVENSLKQGKPVPTRYLLDLPVVWPEADAARSKL